MVLRIWAGSAGLRLSGDQSPSTLAAQAACGRICGSGPDRLEAATSREGPFRPLRPPPSRRRFMTTNAPAITGSVLFYSQPEPLSPETHGKAGVKSMDGPFGFAKVGHAIPLTVGEFPPAALTGPIIFVGDEKMPIAVMGLSAVENMFLRPDGLFEAGCYVPAYIRRYPFVFANDDKAQQMVLCVDMAAEFVVKTKPD